MIRYRFSTKEYFEELYDTSDEPWGISYRSSQQYRYKFCLQLLKRFSARYESVLDIGCSQGQFTVLLKDVASKITAIDISERAIQRAKKQYGEYENIKFEVGGLPLLPYNNNSFNLITALEVLYYLEKEERKRALGEIKRVLKNDGFLLLSVKINKPPYFQMDEFYDLVDNFFRIDKVEYNYGRIYSFFERRLLIFDRTVFKKIIRFFLSITMLVSISQFLTKLILGRKGVTTMYILAKNA